MITPEELKRLREVEKAATAAPWYGDEFEILALQAPTLMRGNKKIVWTDDYHMDEWDAQFIADARNNWIRLLDEIERLNLELKKFQQGWHIDSDLLRKKQLENTIMTDEIEYLKTENERMDARLQGILKSARQEADTRSTCHIAHLSGELDDAKFQITILTEALEWYADGLYPGDESEVAPGEWRSGKRAREALEKVKK